MARRTITLTQEQMEEGRACGAARFHSSARRGDKNKHGKAGRDLAEDERGGQSERAVYAYYGVPWVATVDHGKRPDIGKMHQIRSTSLPHGSLIVRDDDADGHKFCLVLSHEAPTFHLVGWMWGRDAKQAKWRRGPGGRVESYFVPQSELRECREGKA